MIIVQQTTTRFRWRMPRMARFLSFAVRRDARINPSATAQRPLIDDAQIQARLNRSMRRRLSDDLGNMIRRACFSRHTETARGLLQVLNELMAWEDRQFPNCPRAGYETLMRDLTAEIVAVRPLDRLPLADAAD
jgi:hypothetical protein